MQEEPIHIVDPAKTISDNQHTEGIGLTRSEVGIFNTLTSDPGRVFDQDNLYLSYYKRNRYVEVGPAEQKMARTTVQRLNNKLMNVFGAELIYTVRGVGYTLTPPEQ